MLFSFKLCLLCQDLLMPKSKNSSGIYCPKCKILRTSRLSRSACVPDPGQVRNGYGRARGVWTAPRGRVPFVQALQTSIKTNKRSSHAEVKQNKRSRVCHRKIRNSSNYRLEIVPIFVNYPGAANVIIRYNRSRKITSSTCGIFATSPFLVSLSIHPRSRRGAQRIRKGEGR